jgi:hypothetical protein
MKRRQGAKCAQTLTQETPGTAYDSGEWIATTMGQFLQILVDSGEDPAVVFRVIEDTPAGNASFVRRYELLCVPNGAVVATVLQVDPKMPVNKVLLEFIRQGLVK